MKVAIAYYSQHHGNTKKLLDAIKDLADVELINVVECKKADLSVFCKYFFPVFADTFCSSHPGEFTCNFSLKNF